MRRKATSPAHTPRLAEGQDLTLLMSQSDMNHSRGLIDVVHDLARGERVRVRHCERSEAIQKPHQKDWIASSLCSSQ
jgi:hypothetical protein